MLKNIQHRLLLRHPLLWNIRVVPLLAISLAIHILFLLCGFLVTGVDFSEYNNHIPDTNIQEIAIFLSILISILQLIGWLFLYFRNNAFKSFYPLGRHSLYREWLLLFLTCVVSISYMFSFFFGQDVATKSYFSEEEFSRRIDVISMASLFADAPLLDDGNYVVKVNGEQVWKHRDYTTYHKKRYPLNSIFNKRTYSFSYQGKHRDSLNELRVKNWLEHNQRDSVLWLMQEFHAIAKSHNAVPKLKPEEWLGFVYHYPDFAGGITVGREARYDENAQDYYDAEAMETVMQVTEEHAAAKRDTVSNTIKIEDGNIVIYPKYHVPLRQMETAYTQISEVYTSPGANLNLAMFYLLFGMMLALAIFSFRVTSGRAWLIALVCFGVGGLITALAGVMLNLVARYYDSTLYFGMWLVLLAGMFWYFFTRSAYKGRSAIILNILLWLSPWILPALNSIVIETIRPEPLRWGIEEESPPYIQWMNDYYHVFLLMCVAAFIIFMYFFTTKIKKWKGIAEA